MKTKFKTIVANNIKQARLNLGLTQRELARRSGLDPRVINRIERTPQNLTLAVIETIADALGLTPVSLISNNGFTVACTEDELKEFDAALETVRRVRAKMHPIN